MKNKTLWITFAALLTLFLLSKLFNKRTVRSFTTDIIQIDTSAVDKIVFHNADPNVQFELIKTGNKWKAKNKTVEAEAMMSTVSSLLNNLNNIKAQRPVAKSKNKWAEYEVDDEKGKRIELYSGSKAVEDLVIGRFNFNQQTRSAKSYVRRSNDDNVYVVDGFISMSINQSIDAYRDKNVLSLNTSDISSIELSTETGRTSAEKENYWINQAGEVIDSSAMATYVNALSRVQGATFYDDSKQVSSPIKELKITQQNNETITIKCFAHESEFIIHSTQNPKSYFSSDSTGIFKALFLDAAF